MLIRNNNTERRAFTILELLVVIVVIALMVQILISTSYRFIVAARESATAATITKANGIIRDRVRAFQEFDFSDAAIRFQNQVAGNDLELSEILVRKDRFKRSFPQSFAELSTSQIATFFGGAAIPPSGQYQPKFESGIVLYAMLTKGDTFGAGSPGDDTFTSAEVRISPETGGLPCLVDAWGEPIRFYRWPTRLIRCQEQDYSGSGSSSDVDGPYDDFNQNGVRDAGGYGSAAMRPYFPRFAGAMPASLLISNLPSYDRDSPYALGPDGFPGVANSDDDGVNGVDDLGEIGWWNSDDPEPLNTDPDDPKFRLGSALTTQTAINSFTQKWHDPYTFHTPLLLSAGPDRKLGIYEPTDTSSSCGYLAAPITAPRGASAAKTTLPDLFDNITNLNQRPGGKQ
jgi:type II secretory pathway pseudopilin PulG